MGIFSRLQENSKVIKWARDSVGKMSKQVADAIRGVFSVKWSYPARRDAYAYLELFHQTPRLDAVDIIATDCANAVFKVYSKSDLRLGKENAEAIGDHPIYDLIENPIPSRPDFDGFTLLYLTYVWMELQGDCYWVVVKDIRGQPRELYPIPSTWIIQTPTEAIPYFLVMPQGNTASQTLMVEPSDVVWFKYPNVAQPYARGRGRAEALGDEIESDEYAAKYGKNFFFNDATPRSVITAPGANDATIKQLKEQWNQNYQGVANASKTGFLGWDAKLLQLSTSPKEMDFIGSRGFFRDQANQHWQIPPELFGILESSNRSTIDASFFLYTKNVLLKRLLRYESVINRQLMPMFDPKYAIKHDNVVPEDKEFALKVSQEGFAAGAITRGEWRTKNGMALLGNEKDDELLIPFNLAPQNINEKTPEPKPQITAQDEESGNANEPLPKPEPNVALDQALPDIPPKPLEPPAKSIKSARDEYRTKIWHQFDKTATAQEYPFKKAVKKYADMQQKMFNEQFENRIGAGESPAEAIDSTTEDIFGDKANNDLKKSLYAGWLDSMRAGMSLANDIADLSVTFNQVQPAFRAWVDEYGLDKAKSINDTTKEGLRVSLGDGVEAGESILDLQKRIEAQYDELRGFRSERIARTESAGSMNIGSLSTYKSAGIEYKEWLAEMDDRTRIEHADADGQIVSIDDTFNIGGESLAYPGDPSGSAGTVINCRCVILPITKKPQEENI